MKSNSLSTYFSPSMGSFNHFLFLFFWCSQSIDLRGIKVAERGQKETPGIIQVRRGWRSKVGQDTETVRTGSKGETSALGDEVNVQHH